MTCSTKAEKILDVLKALYPDAESELDFKNPYQLLVAVLLSAQCTDKKVNQVTPALFAKYPNFEKLAQAEVADVENIIRQVNYYKTKARNLIATGEAVSTKHAGKLPLNHKQLIELPGVGRKTANVVLSELGIEAAIAVDTHVFRLSQRLELSQGQNVLAVELDLQKKFKPKDWRSVHHGLILHGRRVCKAQSPLCSTCGLKQLCPSVKKYTHSK